MGDYYSQMKQRESIAEANTAFREPPARLTFCVVTAVDIQNRSVTIKHAGSSLEETSVSYTSLSANSKAGQDNIPSKGDVAVVASTATGTKIILGFVGGSNRSAEVALKEGDMLSKSLGDSIIKQDADGNIFLCTRDGSHILLTKTGDFKLYASSLNIETPFLKIADLEVGGVPYQKKEIFRSKPSVSGTTNETMHLLLEGEPLLFETRFPVITEHLGAKVDSDGNLSLLDVGLIPKKEIIRSIEIRNKDTGAIVYSEEIDSDGNMKISGGTISIDGMAQADASKLGLFKNQVELLVDSTVVSVGITEWDPLEDTLFVYVGGIYQTEGIEYTINIENKTVLGSWDTGTVLDFLVLKNVQNVNPNAYINGGMINAGSIERISLSTPLKAELDGLRSDTDILRLGDFATEFFSRDSNDLVTEIRYKRRDGTLLKKSVLSGGVSPKYTTRTATFYAANGITITKTQVYTLNYVGDYLTSEVPQ